MFLSERTGERALLAAKATYRSPLNETDPDRAQNVTWDAEVGLLAVQADRPFGQAA